MSAAEAVFHAKAPADKKASAQAAIRKRFLMVVIMGLLSGEDRIKPISDISLLGRMRNEKLEMRNGGAARQRFIAPSFLSLDGASERAGKSTYEKSISLSFAALYKLCAAPSFLISHSLAAGATVKRAGLVSSLASQAMPLYVILIGMTFLFWMGFFFILLQLIGMKFVILLLPVFQLALGGLLDLRLLGILRRWLFGARGVSKESGAREGKT